MRYTFHTEQGAMLFLFLLVCWLVFSIKQGLWSSSTSSRETLAASVAVTVALILMVKFMGSGPRAKSLPENARSCSDFQKRKLAERPWHGQVCVITGTTSGIGLETVKEVALLGAHVVMVDMHENKDENSIPAKTIKMIKKADPQASLTYVKLNLIELDNIAAAALEIVKAASALRGIAAPAKLSQQPQQQCIDYFVNNAGFGMTERVFSKEGFDTQFQVNYLGPYLLTEHLLPYVTNNGRVVNVASVAHTWIQIFPNSLNPVTCLMRAIEDLNNPRAVLSFSGQPYSLSKFCNLVHAVNLGRRFDKDKNRRDTVVCSVYPGAVFSSIWLNVFKNPVVATICNFFMALGFKTNHGGCQTTLHCLTAGNIIRGQYYADCQPYRPREEARSQANQEAIEKYTREKLGKWLPTK